MGVKPKHIAIILDGNGRWAKNKHLPRMQGHRAGFKKIPEIAKAVKERQIPYLTIYCFSTENWNRPKDEVDGLMKLVKIAEKNFLKNAIEHKIRIRWIGKPDSIPAHSVKALQHLVDATRNFSDLNLTIAFNYSGRDEIVRAIQKISKDIADRKVRSDDFTDFNHVIPYLDTHELPDVDLVIRTSGEQRLSNFMMLQCAYAEFFFTPTHWPDFSESILDEALESFAKRNRRFGAIKE